MKIKLKKFKALWVEEDVYDKAKKQAVKENLKTSMLVKILVNGYLIAKDYKNEN